MAQAGPEVLAVVVALLLIEGGLGVQAPQRGPQPQELCLPPLPVPVLAADVLGPRAGDRGQGGGAGLPGRSLGLTQTQAHSLQGPGKQEDRDLRLFF